VPFSSLLIKLIIFIILELSGLTNFENLGIFGVSVNSPRKFVLINCFIASLLIFFPNKYESFAKAHYVIINFSILKIYKYSINYSLIFGKLNYISSSSYIYFTSVVISFPEIRPASVNTFPVA